MGSLAESAIAYRAECTLLRGGYKGTEGKKGREGGKEEGVGGFC